MKSNDELVKQGKVYKQILKLTKLFSNVWWQTDKEFPNILGNKKTHIEKKKNEKQTNKFIDEFVALIEKFPKEYKERVKWKAIVNDKINDFVESSEIILKKDKEILLNQGLLKITQDFIYEARKFDPNINIEDIGQAMRNVWIMNIIQMLLGKSTKFTTSVFGYSMLYPYTDNYLDSSKISRSEKKSISDKFEKRLNGEECNTTNEYETNLFRLVSKIEEQYNREDHIEVFESLISIHKAQKKSLMQQGKNIAPYESDILGISIEKGGSSVLADAYLANGTLSDKEAEFFFGYGVLLQISDDLQDIKEDVQNNHMTIMSQLSNKWDLDNVTNGLINFTTKLIYEVDCFKVDNIGDLKELISKNCLLLILFAIAKNKNLYSKKYFKEMEQYFPYTTRYMNNFYKRLKRRYCNIKESYNGVATEEIIMEALS